MSYCDETQTQAHHWVLEIPSGPVSLGTCQRCGDTREFANTVDDRSFVNPWQPQPKRQAYNELSTTYPDGFKEQL